jgi:hypothetical protein
MKEYVLPHGGRERQFDPAETGFNATAVQTGTVTGKVMDLRGFSEEYIATTITNTGGGTTGLAKIVATLLDEDGVTLYTMDLVTAINLKATHSFYVSLGRYLTPYIAYTGSAPTLPAGAAAIKFPAFMRLDIVNTEAFNGTTAKAAMRVRASAP